MALLSDVGDGDRGRADSDVPSSAIVRPVEGAGRLLYQQNGRSRIPLKKLENSEVPATLKFREASKITPE